MTRMGNQFGAGVIPFAVEHGRVRFLFHRTFSGRRAGLLVDFGGGGRAGESYAQTAAREFVEETDAMFFADNLQTDLALLFQSQYQHMQQMITETQQSHPDWYCGRRSKTGAALRNWKTFFVEVGFRDPTAMNAAWSQDTGARFNKRRELLWLSSNRLLDIVDNRPEQLWKRIREYVNMRDAILAIEESSAKKP